VPAVPPQPAPAAAAEPASQGSAPAARAEPAGGRQAATAPQGPLTALERKQRAWARYYKKPPHCDNNPSSDSLVDCANHFIRARRQFEEDYAAGKL
jgi:hypothetical protein